MLSFLDLCSGIGGGRLGLEKTGMKCVGYCDTSRLAKQTYDLLHKTKDEFFINNIKKITSTNIPKYDVLIAGFPCQSFSVIGRKKGLDDKRGQLIYNLAEIISFSQPKYFILENVKGLITHNKGKTLSKIVNSLVKCGYNVDFKVIKTLDFGIPQNRQRVYFVGIRTDLFNKPFEWPKPYSFSNNPSNYFLKLRRITEENLFYFKNYLMNSTNNGKYSLEKILNMNNCIIDTRMNDLRIYCDKMPTLRSQRDGIFYVSDKKLYQLTGVEALLFQGFSIDNVNSVINNVTDRHLLMQAGNAMSVNVIEALGNSIINYNNQTKHQNIDINNKEDITMTKWEEFEIQCTKYLTDNFPNISFIHQGGSNSTVADIKVCSKNGEYFIEAKNCPAQCGQFVLLPNLKTISFDYSSQNVNIFNKHAQVIINYMNKEFDLFKEAGTAGKDIIFPKCQDIFSDWIIDAYKKKGVRFIISNNYKIVRIEDFAKAFFISAKYRIKRSGSSSVGKSFMTTVKNEIVKKYNISSFRENGTKLFISSSIELHNSRFIIDGTEFMISKRETNTYEIRKLSNTFNANAIFSIDINHSFEGIPLSDLKNII